MPQALVRTKEQEQMWRDAARQAYKSLTQEDPGEWESVKNALSDLDGWGLVMHIYNRMLKDKGQLPKHLKAGSGSRFCPRCGIRLAPS